MATIYRGPSRCSDEAPCRGWRPLSTLPESKACGGGDSHGGHSGAGYRYIHTTLDDRTRLTYSELHDDERAVTAAGLWARAVAWFAAHGVAW